MEVARRREKSNIVILDKEIGVDIVVCKQQYKSSKMDE